MSADPAIKGSGDGTRPTTDGGVDNLGAGEKFAAGQSAAGETNTGPAPSENMADKRADVETTKKDDAVPFNLHGDPTPVPNVEPGRPPNNH